MSRQAGRPRPFAVAVLGLALASAAHANYVVNPTFQGGLFGWNMTNPSVFDDGPASPDVPYGSGPFDQYWSYYNAAATANDYPSPASLTQEITGLNIGKPIFISFDAATYDTFFYPYPLYNGVSLSLEGVSIDVTGISAPSVMNWQWEHFTATGIATSTSGLLTLSMFDDGIGIDVTNVVVTPEPAPFAAIGLGVVGLLICRRR